MCLLRFAFVQHFRALHGGSRLSARPTAYMRGKKRLWVRQCNVLPALTFSNFSLPTWLLGLPYPEMECLRLARRGRDCFGLKCFLLLWLYRMCHCACKTIICVPLYGGYTYWGDSLKNAPCWYLLGGVEIQIFITCASRLSLFIIKDLFKKHQLVEDGHFQYPVLPLPRTSTETGRRSTLPVPSSPPT